MVSSCRVFTYSPNNRYAQDYYLACKKFDDARNELIKCEQNPEKVSHEKYKELQKKFEYWDKEVPRLTIKAGREEKLLEQRAKERNLEQSGLITNSNVGKNINFIA